MPPHASFSHAHHDLVEPSPDHRGIRRADSTVLAHVPRSSPEVMESIAVALLSLTVPGVCLRAGSEIRPELWDGPYGSSEPGGS
ncbi:hypothetical protein [Kitasatospora sp. SUK 42]|uniref:hypothetical protein n=1 Tax=Kitasatospora sp. SUK 42 TaxID=1588882 RepID=UPI0018C93756|nr:hypothetical protein [Kitasatospora sp. SUK 42]MBV2155136.1 hypothetical protein [Kitasatospora sp. SUK 42]